ADEARVNLFEVTRLSIGKVAPEIDGNGIDGKSLKLSDYRGRVVVLSFWASWCGPCMAMVPHERALVQRMKGKRFALLGINGDQNLESAKHAIQTAGITWPSWQNRRGPDG